MQQTIEVSETIEISVTAQCLEQGPQSVVPGLDIDWKELTKKVIIAGIGKIPEAGPVLSGLVSILWPSSPKQDVWGEIKDQTQQLINKTLAEYVVNNVNSALNGLIGVLDNYLDAKNGGNGQKIEGTWIASNTTFIDRSANFQQKGYEVLLLPLFAQMANLHIALLRDGVLQKFCFQWELQKQISQYTTYALYWQEQAAKDDRSKTFSNYNPATRYIELSVGTYIRLWPYFDPILYPNPVTKFPIGPEIFYNLWEIVSYEENVVYRPRGPYNSFISQLRIWFAQYKGAYETVTYLCGTDVRYTSGEDTGFTGHQNSQSRAFLVDVSPDDPIVKVIFIGQRPKPIDPHYFTLMLQFVFKSGRTSNPIPTSGFDADAPTSPELFNITPPDGYFMTSMLCPSEGFSQDAIFGFRSGITPDPAEYVNFDPKGWATTAPVSGSPHWVVGYSVQYAIAWVYDDGTVSNVLSWCPPITGGWAMPRLLLPTSTNPKVVGRRVYRHFAGFPVELIGTINDSKTVEFNDDNM